MNRLSVGVPRTTLVTCTVFVCSLLLGPEPKTERRQWWCGTGNPGTQRGPASAATRLHTMRRSLSRCATMRTRALSTLGRGQPRVEYRTVSFCLM